MWGVGCKAWGVGCGVWGVGCGVARWWGVGCGVARWWVPSERGGSAAATKGVFLPQHSNVNICCHTQMSTSQTLASQMSASQMSTTAGRLNARLRHNFFFFITLEPRVE